jgi:hypothetical protein
MLTGRPWDEEFSLSRDEKRMVRLFRCLPGKDREEVLIDIGRRACVRCLGEEGFWTTQPESIGISSFDVKYDEKHDPAAPATIVRHALDCATAGDYEEFILGSSDSDEYAGQILHAEIEGQAVEHNVWLCGEWKEKDCVAYFEDWRWWIVIRCEYETEQRRRSVEIEEAGEGNEPDA